METIKAVIGLAPVLSEDAVEPVAGAKGSGTAIEPFDLGNQPEACEAAERERAEEDERLETTEDVTSTGTEKAVDTKAQDKKEEDTTAQDETGDRLNEKAEEKNDKEGREQKKEPVEGNTSDGKPKENPDAIPTAGGEKLGTQPVPEREEADELQPSNGEAKGPNAEEAAKDHSAPTETKTEEKTAANGTPTPVATATPTKEAPKPASPAQKAVKESEGLQRKPSKISRLVNRLKGKSRKSGEGVEDVK